MYDWGCLGSTLLEGPWLYFGSASRSIQVVVLSIVDEQHPVPEKTYTLQQMAMELPPFWMVFTKKEEISRDYVSLQACNHVHHGINYQAQLMLWCNNTRT